MCVHSSRVLHNYGFGFVEKKSETNNPEADQKKLKVEKQAFDTVLRRLVESKPIKRGPKRQSGK